MKIILKISNNGGNFAELPPVMEEEDAEKTSDVQVIEIIDGVARQVSYSSLKLEDKKNVLADLLVKSAINHALEKQKKVPNMK